MKGSRMRLDKSCDINGANCTDAGHDMPVIQERRHEFVWVVWTRQGKKDDNAEDDASDVGPGTVGILLVVAMKGTAMEGGAMSQCAEACV